MLPKDFKPYLIRALYEWCADQGSSPYLVVAVNASCKVPNAYVKDNQIVLDISMDATQALVLGNDEITFEARFGGVAQRIYVPMNRVMGLFPEDDQSVGIFFEIDESENTTHVVQQHNNLQTNSENVENPSKPLFSRVK